MLDPKAAPPIPPIPPVPPEAPAAAQGEDLDPRADGPPKAGLVLGAAEPNAEAVGEENAFCWAGWGAAGFGALPSTIANPG